MQATEAWCAENRDEAITGTPHPKQWNMQPDNTRVSDRAQEGGGGLRHTAPPVT